METLEVIGEYRYNRIYKEMYKLYEMELPHQVRAQKAREVLEELVPTAAELKEYNDHFGIHSHVDYYGAHVTSVSHPNRERIIVTRYKDGQIGEDGESGLLTIDGRRAKYPDSFFDIKQETILEAIRRVRAETFITQYEKDVIVDALLEFKF